MRIEKLRPHHLLDILKDYAPDDDPDYRPAPGENGVRSVTRALAASLDTEVEFVVGPDTICEPCSHLKPGGKCDRILDRHKPPQPIDEYNDDLDRRLLACLGLTAGARMTLRRFLVLVNARVPGLEAVCTHPTEERAARLAGLIAGLTRLGVRAR